jgi:hypothetical protein
MKGIASATLLWVSIVLPSCLAAQTVRLLDGDRQTSAAVTVNRHPTTGLPVRVDQSESTADFRCFDSDLRAVLNIPLHGEYGTAAAIQHSCVLAESVVADGSVDGWAFPAPAGSAMGGHSLLTMRFDLDTRVQYHTRGWIRSRADAGGGAALVRAITTFALTSGADSVLSESLCWSTQPEFPGACADSTEVVREGWLEPGTYTLSLRAVLMGYVPGGPGGQTQIYRGSAGFGCSLVFDAPIVRLEPASWTRVKKLYADME